MPKNNQLKAYWNSIRNMIRLLTPGLGIKRWVLVMFLGVTLIAIGAAFFLLEIYRTAPDTWWLPVISTIALRSLDRPIRVIIFAGLGFGVLAWAVWKMNAALMTPFLTPGQPVVDTITSYRRRERGPRIIAIGGGTGLSTLLRGLKLYTHNLTAVVTVADDGGSSGRLRQSLGILPPGDIRNCLAALSNDEKLLTQLFQYRFSIEEAGLQGHSFGNLFISAMTEITGSFESAIAESGRVLSVHGRVLPSTLHDVHLVADIVPEYGENELRIKGESRIPEVARTGQVRRVWLEPGSPPAFPPVVRELLNADVIVVGPGSLYTSVLPNLLVQDVAEAIRASRALKVYVCNIAVQVGETHGYTVADHLQAIDEHVGGEDLFDLVIVHQPQQATPPHGVEWVPIGSEEGLPPLYKADIADKNIPWRHDSEKLARTIMNLYLEKTGPLTL